MAFQQGMRVRIIRGPFAGREGLLVSVGNPQRFRVDLNQIGQSILIDFSPDLLEPIDAEVQDAPSTPKAQ